ncbi:MAG: hypothetical protein OES47_06805 [Acidobacteriota bacterium]|nr:hypothetical protein [Acidobacteriota bacterium]
MSRKLPSYQLLLALVALIVVAPLAAQTVDEGIALRPEVQRRLGGLQERWLEWLTTVQASELVEVERAASALVEEGRRAGLSRFPDLSLAASARAVQFAKEGEMERASWSLDLAEELDSRRSETAFARATVAGLDGRFLKRMRWQLVGFGRLRHLSLQRYVVMSNLMTWLLNSLALGALAFVGLQMATRGQVLYRDILDILGRSLPVPAAHGLAISLLLWPILLPTGLLWLALFWSVLLWGYGTRSERIAMICIWVFAGALPFLVTEQTRRMGLRLSRPLLAVENVAAGRFGGALLADLSVLNAVLPESVARKHLFADLHLKLRQWERARLLYDEVLSREPANTAALSDLGTCRFYEGDFEGAVKVLGQATARPEASAAAFFNLSRAYSELFRFEEADPVLKRASSLESDLVLEWSKQDISEQVISTAGGFQRRDEIRDELLDAWKGGEADPSFSAAWRRTLSLPLALVLIMPALALQLIRRKAGNRSRRISTQWWKGSPELLRKIFLPGVVEAEQGHSLRAIAALVVLVFLASLPMCMRLGYSLPMGYDPRIQIFGWLAAIGLALFFFVRWLRLRGPEGPPARQREGDR